jgi:hypothetical protein
LSVGQAENKERRGKPSFGKKEINGGDYLVCSPLSQSEKQLAACSAKSTRRGTKEGEQAIRGAAYRKVFASPSSMPRV